VVARTKADATLTTLIAGRLYPDARPQTAPLPALTYATVSNIRGHNLTSADGVSVARVQFDAWASRKSDAVAIKARLEAIWDGYRGRIAVGADELEVLWAKQINDVDLSERPADGSDQMLYRLVIEYHIKHRVTIPTF
jgi:hypothetical protein